MYTPTCAPGEFYDPTGKSRTQNTKVFERTDFESKINLSIATEVNKTFDDKKNNDFLEVAVEAFGYRGYDACSDIVSLICKELVSKAMVQQLRREIFYLDSSEKSKRQMNDLTSIAYLSEHLEMQNLRNKLQFEADRYLNKNGIMKKIKDEIFENTKSLTIEWLNEVLPSGKVKDDIIFKISKVRFSGFDCTNGKIDVPRDIEPNGEYNSLSNSLKFCKGSLHYTDSIFAIVRTLAHELGHAIDPCLIQFYFSNRKFTYAGSNQIEMESEFPFSGIIPCLRDKKSVEAKRFDPANSLSSGVHPNPMGGTGFGSFSPDPVPNKIPTQKFDFCKKQNENGSIVGDQVNEAFCDWLASEILPRYIEKYHHDITTPTQFRAGYLNVFRTFCYPDYSNEKVGFRVHPSINKRANSILLANPKVREQMGCSKDLPGTIYCDPKKIKEVHGNSVEVKGGQQ